MCGLSVVTLILLFIGQVFAVGKVEISSTEIRGTKVRIASIGSKVFDTVIFAIPGKETTIQDMTLGVYNAASKGGCSNRVKVITVDFGKTPYNLLGRKLIGELQLNVVMDKMVKKYGRGKKVVLVGFSKGAQAIQRYSLVHKITGQKKFLLGCASSWTLLDEKVNWKYGLRNFPPPFDVKSIVPNARKNEYLIVCGSEDKGSSDNSKEAKAQGAGRIDRAKSLLKNLASKKVKANMRIAKGVGHNAAKVFEKTAGKYICS
ncbi:hypothetical protein HDV02_001590 [Globomyces sp. JEL0801]|nr:hypothetical protein HDV02_001590 [Globomyces sp. JEL0801]